MIRCPACLNDSHDVILTRDRVPVLQNVIVPTPQEALNFAVAKLRICLCHGCGFVWNADFDPAAIDYDAQYNNSVQQSQVYRAHQQAMAERILRRPGNLFCLEVGCGEGEFLKVLSASGRLRGAIGFDPAHKGSYLLDASVHVIRGYFDEAAAATLPDDIDVVISRHTIEHIPDPRAFIASIATYVKKRRLPLFLETPDVNWIFRNNAFEDFFYEHCSLFSPRSMTMLLAEFGLECTVHAVYGEQYMWIEARPADTAAKPAAFDAIAYDGIARSLDFWTAKVQALKADGPVAVWGAASKGVTFSLLIDGIDFAIDLNPSKQGCYMPVSATPIVSPETALSQGVASIIVMNVNYAREIADQLETMGWKGKLLLLQDQMQKQQLWN